MRPRPCFSLYTAKVSPATATCWQIGRLSAAVRVDDGRSLLSRQCLWCHAGGTTRPGGLWSWGVAVCKIVFIVSPQAEAFVTRVASPCPAPRLALKTCRMWSMSH